MNILHIANDLTDRGNGIVNVMMDLAAEQARSGNTVVIAAGHGAFQHLLPSLNVQYFHLDQTRSLFPILKSLWSLHAFMASFKPEIVHAHMRTGVVLAWIATRFPRRVLVSHLHNVHDPQSRWMRLADRVITVSASVKRSMSSVIAPEKMSVVLNGPLNSPRNTPLSHLAPFRGNRPSIVTVAGLNHRKGIAELITAFDLVAKTHPTAHLYIVGDGPERELFEGQASRSIVAHNIHFEGFQPNPQRYMLGADIFVLASRRDSLGLALLEAREAGCAIIGTNVDGIPEALDNGKAGILVPVENPRSLATAIIELLDSETLRQQWAVRARENCSRFTCKTMADGVEEVYRELLAKAL